VPLLHRSDRDDKDPMDYNMTDCSGADLTTHSRPHSLQYDSAEWEPAFLRQARFVIYDSQFPLASSRFGRDSIQYRVGKTHCQGHQDPSKRVPIFPGAWNHRSLRGAFTQISYTRFLFDFW